jgi:restriction system protein
LGWYTVDFVKAKFLRKNNGIWSVLPEGEEWLKKGETAITDEAIRRYREWDRQRKSGKRHQESKGGRDKTASASDVLAEHLRDMGDFDFQDAVAVLMRAMSYIVRFVARRGHADGGVDIIAYCDPLGAKTPRIKVQVKHQEGTVGRSEVNKLNGLLSDGEIGVFVSSSGFSKPSEDFARAVSNHLELIDRRRFVELWIGFCSKMNESDREKMPSSDILSLALKEDD